MLAFSKLLWISNSMSLLCAYTTTQAYFISCLNLNLVSSFLLNNTISLFDLRVCTMGCWMVVAFVLQKIVYVYCVVGYQLVCSHTSGKVWFALLLLLRNRAFLGVLRNRCDSYVCHGKRMGWQGWILWPMFTCGPLVGCTTKFKMSNCSEKRIKCQIKKICDPC